MTYSPDQAEQLESDLDRINRELQEVLFEGHQQALALQHERARVQLQHGVGRRINVLTRSMLQIFELFRPQQGEPLNRDVLTDVQIYLHAFVINLSGVFDNWAWAFVFRHGLEGSLSRMAVGMFKADTQQYLPASLVEHLTSSEISSWHERYAKKYRDALAHRIPLYIPPAAYSDDDSRRYNELEHEKFQCIHRMEWCRLEEVEAEQKKIGRSCGLFMHEFSDHEDSKPVLLHPQVLTDALTVADFGKRFYAAWHERR